MRRNLRDFLSRENSRENSRRSMASVSSNSSIPTIGKIFDNLSSRTAGTLHSSTSSSGRDGLGISSHHLRSLRVSFSDPLSQGAEGELGPELSPEEYESCFYTVRTLSLPL